MTQAKLYSNLQITFKYYIITYNTKYTYSDILDYFKNIWIMLSMRIVRVNKNSLIFPSTDSIRLIWLTTFILVLNGFAWLYGDVRFNPNMGNERLDWLIARLWRYCSRWSLCCINIPNSVIYKTYTCQQGDGFGVSEEKYDEMLVFGIRPTTSAHTASLCVYII